MGILSINRNLLSNSRAILKYLSSSSSQYIRRISSPAAEVPVTNGPIPYIPRLVDDLNLSNNNKFNNMFLIQHSPKGDRSGFSYSLLSEKNKSWKDHHNLGSPFFGLATKYLVAGSGNELILLFFSDSTQPRNALWNPTNHRIKTLPLSTLQRPRTVASTHCVDYGFGFDSESQDYKVIIFLQFIYEDGSASNFGEYFIELYSFKTNSWKKITSSPEAHLVRQPSAPAHINGVLYWVALDGPYPTILSFDFDKEKFSHIPLPSGILKPKGGLFDGYVLADYLGSLAVLVHSELRGREKPPFSFEILVWNGESWDPSVPMVVIGDLLGGSSVARVLGFFENHKLFLQGFRDGELLLFDLQTKVLERLGIYGDEEDPRMLGIFPYVGSSVPFYSVKNNPN